MRISKNQTTMTVSISNIIDSRLAINDSDGKSLYKVISKIDPSDLILSFDKIERISTAFLNESIGKYALANPSQIHLVKFEYPNNKGIFKYKVEDVIENALLGETYNEFVDSAVTPS